MKRICGKCGLDYYQDSCPRCSLNESARAESPEGNHSVNVYSSPPSIELYTVESNLDEFIDEVLAAVSGVGYRWVWLTSAASVRVAQEKALRNLRQNASNLGADGVIGVRTSITAFPGFLLFRGCAVLVTGTAVIFKSDEE